MKNSTNIFPEINTDEEYGNFKLNNSELFNRSALEIVTQHHLIDFGDSMPGLPEYDLLGPGVLMSPRKNGHSTKLPFFPQNIPGLNSQV